MKHLKKLLADSKTYVLIAFLIILLGGVMGYAFQGAFQEQANQILEQIEEIKEVIEDKQSNEYMAWIIFQNNTRAALLMLGIGLIFFFTPIASLFINGVAVGYVLKVSADAGVSPVELFLYGLLPHAVLEIPAIIIAGGVGTFFGVRLLVWLFRPEGFFSHLFGNQRQSVSAFWKEQTVPVLTQRLKGTGMLIVALVLMLFFAALIESYITPALLENYLNLPQNLIE